jgi:hypothetical protein
MFGQPRYTDSLYARPSFLSGMVRLLDFWGVFDQYNFDQYNSGPTPRAADAKAIYSDWRAVGYDLGRGLSRYAREHS